MVKRGRKHGSRMGFDLAGPKFSFMPQRPKSDSSKTEQADKAEKCPVASVNAEDRERSQSFRQWAGSSRMTLAIIFTDIVNSTSLGHRLGNEQMGLLRHTHFNRARSLIDKLYGYEIKTNGDEFMVAFHTAVDALDFALELQGDTGDERICIRAGIHVGPVSIEEQDAQGATVSYAARVMSIAKDGGVVLSSEAKNHIDQEKAQRHKSLLWQKNIDCLLKGFPGNHLLWTVENRD